MDGSENQIFDELEKLRKNQLVLMSPQRQEDKLIKIYEILPEGIQVIDKTETEGFDNVNFKKTKSEGEILETINEIINKIQKMSDSINEKDEIIKKLNFLKNKLEI